MNVENQGVAPSTRGRSAAPSGLSRCASQAEPAATNAARFYIDCEFDGHGGPLLSIAMVREDGLSIHVSTSERATDPWVVQNVVPLLNTHAADIDGVVSVAGVGGALRYFIGVCDHPTIVADSPVDIGRFCAAISTGDDGGWASTGYRQMTFEVHNVDCYPTDLPSAVQHNAWWDAMALRHKLRDNGSRPEGENSRSEVEGEARQSGSPQGEIAQTNPA